MKKYNEINGNYNAKQGPWAIVLSRFNSLIGERLLEGAVDALVRHGAEEDSIEIDWKISKMSEVSSWNVPGISKDKILGFVCQSPEMTQ